MTEQQRQLLENMRKLYPAVDYCKGQKCCMKMLSFVLLMTNWKTMNEYCLNVPFSNKTF